MQQKTRGRIVVILAAVVLMVGLWFRWNDQRPDQTAQAAMVSKDANPERRVSTAQSETDWDVDQAKVKGDHGWAPLSSFSQEHILTVIDGVEQKTGRHIYKWHKDEEFIPQKNGGYEHYIYGLWLDFAESASQATPEKK